MIIYEAFPKDAGTYVVNAKNIAGESSSTCSVSVKGRLPTETSDSEMASDMEPVKPSIQLPLTNVTVNEGNRVRLDCVIVGQPEPEVIWYHNDKPVKESPDFQLLFQGDRCSLVIQDALQEDAGEYKVVALNSAGEASSKCILSVASVEDVTDKAKSDETKQEILVSGSAPKFTKLLTDVLISEGDNVNFEANVVGEPRPEIKWLLNNYPVTDHEHFQMSYDNAGNIKLVIQSVRPEDKGVYTVKATNLIGEAKCFAQLIVKSFKAPETIKHQESKTAPVFKQVLSDKIAFENTPTKFECIAVGKPTPKVRWLFNGEAITGKQFLVSTSGDWQVLSIPILKPEHSGTITCIAENEMGQASCAANLSVQSVAAITLPDQALQTSINQQVESSYFVNREIRTESSTSKSSKVISSGPEAVQPHVEVHSYSSNKEQTYKQINQQTPEIKESQKIEEYHQVGNKAPVIHEKSSVTFSSGVESNKSDQKIVEVIKPQIKLRPPKFVTPVIGKIVDQHVDVILEGILDGQPTPKVTWLKNGQEISNSDKVKITWSLNKATIELKDVTTSDAGRYTCSAENEAGTAVSTADLVVRSNFILNNMFKSIFKLLNINFRNHFPTCVWSPIASSNY